MQSTFFQFTTKRSFNSSLKELNKMLPVLNVTHHTVKVNGIRMHYVEAGEGAPVFMLHGYPETWFAWRKQIPVLAKKYRLIVPDLRGYGGTDKPQTGYDKRNMAKDIYDLMKYLGYGKIAIVSHDRGSRVATRFAKDYRSSIDRLVTMDNIPTRTVLSSINSAMMKGYWFFYFQQILDLPEALVSGREGIYISHFLRTWSYNPEMLSDEELAVYIREYSQPGAMKGAFNDYRAGPEDWAQDQVDMDQLIDCPTLTLWGADFDFVGKMFDVLEVWKSMAKNIRGIAIPNCGHLPAEEQPEIVNKELIAFLDGWKG
jgi:pimeloyl-ACP methyl ester carboxylesterase